LVKEELKKDFKRYNNAIFMKKLNYYIMDNTNQQIYSSAIHAKSIKNSAWLHLKLVEIKLKPSRRYLCKFQCVIKGKSVIYPDFYLMDNNPVSDILYINCGTTLTGKALCASYQYDIIHMEKDMIFFFFLMFLFMLGITNLKPGLVKRNLCRIPKSIWIIFWRVLFLDNMK